MYNVVHNLQHIKMKNSPELWREHLQVGIINTKEICGKIIRRKFGAQFLKASGQLESSQSHVYCIVGVLSVNCFCNADAN